MILVVDGDFLSYYQAHAMQSNGAKLESFSQQDYVKQCLRTVNYFSSKMLGGRPDLIIFPFDEGKSWRFQYLADQQILYKDRDKTKRELVNFDAYRLALRNTLLSYKFPVITSKGLEADDMIHMLIQLIEEGEVCIMTGDSDMQQKLISTEKKEVFILNPLLKDGFPLLRTIHQPKKELIDDSDFFAEDIPTRWIDTVGNAKVVDPARGLFIKVICGDDTDTIPSAFRYNNGVSQKTVGETRATNYHHDLDPVPTIDTVRKLFHSKEARIELAQNIISFAKLKAFDRINEFEQGLLRNVRCILLDDVVYEPDLLANLKQIVDSHLKMPSPGADLAKIFRGSEFDFSTNYYRN